MSQNMHREMLIVTLSCITARKMVEIKEQSNYSSTVHTVIARQRVLSESNCLDKIIRVAAGSLLLFIRRTTGTGRPSVLLLFSVIYHFIIFLLSCL